MDIPDPPPALPVPGTAGSSSPVRPEPGLAAAAVACLAVRAELLALEAKEAARGAGRRALLVGAAAGLATFAWGLLLAGGIGWLAVSSAAAGRPVAWFWVAIGLGVMHLLIALLIAAALRRPLPTPFEATRAELEKDRQWFADLKRQLNWKR